LVGSGVEANSRDFSQFETLRIELILNGEIATLSRFAI
jgi:hypothetical protein